MTNVIVAIGAASHSSQAMLLPILPPAMTERR
jgi:hypothetical protein